MPRFVLLVQNCNGSAALYKGKCHHWQNFLVLLQSSLALNKVKFLTFHASLCFSHFSKQGGIVSRISSSSPGSAQSSKLLELSFRCWLSLRELFRLEGAGTCKCSVFDSSSIF
ncbi:unnamed protein product [Moneuplotes crassus]|uniref:Uncharacterized protein n=1 Tax=Euplotes crassus TaxID=5936 RepID=A0AAD1Y262_EUPCR|nr:unnamed protein product [Moneuplotes crassus]